MVELVDDGEALNPRAADASDLNLELSCDGNETVAHLRPCGPPFVEGALTMRLGVVTRVMFSASDAGGSHRRSGMAPRRMAIGVLCEMPGHAVTSAAAARHLALQRREAEREPRSWLGGPEHRAKGRIRAGAAAPTGAACAVSYGEQSVLGNKR